MSSTHAAIYVTRGFEQQLSDVFLPVLKLTGKETVNQLWKLIGMYNTDVYVNGPLQNFTVRQLRGFGFIFLARRGQTIPLKDGNAPIDILLPLNYPKNTPAKDFETRIGVDRTRLRKKFGDILRNWALRFTVELHGSEVETLMMADFQRHKVYGLPPIPPNIGIPTTIHEPFPNDQNTDEKLVSLLDYIVMSADVVYYVGSGDLRTLLKFKQKDMTRFYRTLWICIDPIAPKPPYENVKCYREMLNDPEQLRQFKVPGERKEHTLIWDVRSDKVGRSFDEWETVTKKEDELGSYVAMANRDWLSLACIKCRIPGPGCETFNVYASLLVPQPSAPITMYELRSIARLCGFSHIDRTHIPEAREIVVRHSDCCSLVQKFHGLTRGKMLKRHLLEYLHITNKNGLEHKTGLPRVDLFYLTNRRNRDRLPQIHNVLHRSALATVWIGDETHTGYDDFKFSAQSLMLRYSNAERVVLDGNGLVLYLMWKGILGDEGHLVNYDPAWAAKFGVIFKRCYGDDIVPDVSLCRFVGLRRLSTTYRINTDHIHHRADVLKRLGLDVSGHLFMALVSGCYCFDLHWWVKMIKDWSTLDEEGKRQAIEAYHAEVIEWREENANEPWHKIEDLRAAMALASSMDLPDVRAEDFSRWLDKLR
ncbi:VP4 [CHeRI orbivirus 3-3]|nr:VP4 [CHeRI orbivirus 3-3]